MRARLGLLALATALAVGTGPVAADEPAPLATTTTTVASVTQWVVTLTADVATDGEPAPEGSVEFREGSTLIGTVALTDSSATWSGPVTTGTHTYVATYLPVDARWDGSTSAPTEITVAPSPNPCHVYVDSCGIPYGVGIKGPKSVDVGKRARFRISFDSRGSTVQPGVATISITGPRRFSWSTTTRVERRAAVVRTPRLRRSGSYKLRVDATLDQGLERTRTMSVRVVRRPRTR